MFIINQRKIFYLLSGLSALGAIVVLSFCGLRLGTDFVGGAIMEVEYENARPPIETIQSQLLSLNLGQVTIQPVGEQSMLMRFRVITEDEHQALRQKLGEASEKRFSSVGPSLGNELARKGIIATIIVIIMILIYITLAFRTASRPVQSWKYAIISIVKLAHDLIVPLGVFSLLGYFWAVEVDALFLAGLLTIMGLSVNDTIVAFDRIRENLKHHYGSDQTFGEIVGRSLVETMTRSINTSVTVILVLLAIFIFGSDSTRYFTFLLALGMIVVTYSSIFIASPLLVSWQKFSSRHQVKK